MQVQASLHKRLRWKLPPRTHMTTRLHLPLHFPSTQRLNTSIHPISRKTRTGVFYNSGSEISKGHFNSTLSSPKLLRCLRYLGIFIQSLSSLLNLQTFIQQFPSCLRIQLTPKTQYECKRCHKATSIGQSTVRYKCWTRTSQQPATGPRSCIVLFTEFYFWDFMFENIYK